MWKWIEGFLKDRKARCYLKGPYGLFFYTSVGLPQGSVISPILFIIFLQDIFKEISTNGVKYADDGINWVTGRDIKELSKAVEEDLEKIYSWTRKWRMKINIEHDKNLYPPTKGYLREACKSQNIYPIYLNLSSPSVLFRS